MKMQRALPNADLFPVIMDLLSEGHTATLTLRGNSMRPFLVDGRDIACLRQLKLADSQTRRLADLLDKPVLACIDGRWILHRVIKVEGESVTMLGDGNLSPEHCTLADIKAEVVGFYRKGRTTMDRVDGKKWRVYSWWWNRLRWVRRYLLGIDRRLTRLTQN